MKDELSNQILKKYGRVTGLLYLVIIICGMYSEMIVRATLIIPGEAATTVTNIILNSMLFRMGFISDLIMVIADVGVALTFYILLKPVNNGLALLAALFRLTQSSILGINLLNHFKAIILLSDPSYETLLGKDQLSAQVMLHLNAHSYGYLIALVFFALSCIILGYLFYKSSLFPKAFGILLPIAGAGYLVDSFTNFLFPEFASVTEMIVIVSALVAEVGLCLYLIIKGVNSQTHT